MIIQGKEYLDIGDIVWELEDNGDYIILRKWIVKSISVKGDIERSLSHTITYTCQFGDNDKYMPRDITHQEFAKDTVYLVTDKLRWDSANVKLSENVNTKPPDAVDGLGVCVVEERSHSL